MINIQHQQMISKVVDVIKGDSRFAGVAIGGSYITNTMDEYSDLDFVLVAKDGFYQDVMNERFGVIKNFGILLSAFTGEHVGEPRLIICLYDAPILHVDFKFVSVSDFSDRIEDPVILFEEDDCLSESLLKKAAKYPIPELQWIEDRFWVWVHYAAMRLGRNELFEVLDFLSFTRQTVLAPLISMKHNHLPRGVRKFEIDTPDYVEALNKTVATHDVSSCINAIRATIDLYFELREFHMKKDFIRREDAEEKSLAYFEQIQSKCKQKERPHLYQDR